MSAISDGYFQRLKYKFVGPVRKNVGPPWVSQLFVMWKTVKRRKNDNGPTHDKYTDNK